MNYLTMVRTLMVVPVSTRSMTASARPRPQAASTEPDTYLIPMNSRTIAIKDAQKFKIRIIESLVDLSAVS